MKKSLLFLVLLVLLMVACTPAGGSVPAEAEGTPTGTGSALSPLEPEAANMAKNTPETEPIAETTETAVSPTPELVTAEPRTIDLTQITPVPPEQGELIVQPEPGKPNIPEHLKTFIQTLKEDLANRKNLNIEDIQVITIEEVTWPDSGIGCPQPGMMYLTVLTPGYKVILAADNQQYIYHSKDTTYFVLCENNKPAP
ncbi:MAG: hypothetical protein D6706_13425 [Chloroflexi bacterium]|nr:MAG: hypothetical protein D6706_13425 [Chloroflexota bacterium]